MTDIKSTLASLCERVDRTITKRFAEFALAAEKIGKTKEEVSEGNESNKKVKVIKISIFIQSIIAKKDSVEKCFGTFVNRENFLKTKDLKNKDKNNSAKKDSVENFFSKIDLSKNMKNEFVENYFTEKCFGTFINRENFLKTKE